MKKVSILDVCKLNDQTVKEFIGTKEYVATGGIEKDKIVSSTTVSFEGKPSRANREVEIGDILLAKMKDTLKVLLINKENKDYIYSTGFFTIKPDTTIVNTEYIYYVLKSEYFQEKKDKLAKGATQKALNNAGLKKIKIPVPSKAEQEWIVKTLKNVESTLSKRQQQIEALSALKQSIFLDMFGDPNNNNKNWDEYTFKDIVNFHNELRVPIKKLDREKIQGEYPYYGATGIVDYINDYKFDGEYLLISEDGKALFHRNKPIAFIAKGQFWVNNHAHVITTENKSTLIYLERCIELLDISNYITGIDQYKLNRSNISKIKIPLPPSDLQTQYEEKTIKINKQIKQMSIGLKQINNLYNSLMHKAFNGELFKEDIKV